MLRLLFIIFCLLSFTPSPAFAIETLKNTGFIQSNIWYSKDPFYIGDKVRIYSVVFNGSSKDLRGRINFYDNRSLLCTSDFSSLSGRVSEIWCDWSVGSGKHSISIKIVNPRASSPGEEEQAVLLVNGELSVDERLAEISPVPEEVLKTTNNSLQTVDKPFLSNFIQKATDFFSNPVANREGIKEDSVAPDLSPETNYARVPKVSGANKPKSGGASKSGIEMTSLYRAVEENGYDLPRSNLASIRDQFLLFINNHPTLLAIKNWLYSSFAFIKDWILSKLKDASESDSKPLAYMMIFLYTLVKFILESTVILILIVVYTLWKIVRGYFRRRYS